MTYATQQDLIDRYGEEELVQLTDRSGVGAIDGSMVDRALADADAEINGYLTARYSLPLSAVPAVLVRVAADMARYYLFGDAMIDTVKNRYDNAIKLLKGVSAGQVELGVAVAASPVETAGGVSVSATDRVFSSTALDGY